MDGCPLGLGLVVEDKPTEFSCSMRVRISQVGKDRHVDRMLTLIVAHQTPKQEPVPELDRREQPFER